MSPVLITVRKTTPITVLPLLVEMDMALRNKEYLVD